MAGSAAQPFCEVLAALTLLTSAFVFSNTLCLGSTRLDKRASEFLHHSATCCISHALPSQPSNFLDPSRSTGFNSPSTSPLQSAFFEALARYMSVFACFGLCRMHAQSKVNPSDFAVDSSEKRQRLSAADVRWLD